MLAILGLKMVLGYSLVEVERVKGDSTWAIASIIGTPLLTGPAAIMSIIVSASNYGKMVTVTVSCPLNATCSGDVSGAPKFAVGTQLWKITVNDSALNYYQQNDSSSYLSRNTPKSSKN